MISKILVVFLMASLSFAGEAAKNSNTISNNKIGNGRSQPIEIGDCSPLLEAKRKDPNDPTSPLVAQDPRANNDVNLTSEAFAKKEAEKAGLSKEEILARLIYSEALSSGYWNGLCNANSDDDIMKNIGWGVMNRVSKKAPSSLDPYTDVIFARKQFSTSFSGNKTNPFAKSFLCPTKAPAYLDGTSKKVGAAVVYNKAQKIAEDIITEYDKSGIPQRYKGIKNFFYPQSEYFGEMRPTWAPNTDPIKNKGYANILNVSNKPCVESYR